MTVVTVSNTDQALLIILCVFLAMFLLLSIIALVWILQILSELKKIIKRAEELARETEGSINSFFQSTRPIISVVKLLSNMSEAVFKADKNHKHKKDEE